MFLPLVHTPITSNSSLITLFFVVSIALNTIPTAREKQNDPAPIKICNTVYNPTFLTVKKSSGIAGVKKIHFKGIFIFSTIGSTITSEYRTSSLMSLSHLAPAFFPHYQPYSDPPISLCNSITMTLTLAQIILINGAIFVLNRFSDPPVLKPHTQTSFLSPFHKAHQSYLLSLSGMSYRVTHNA